MLIISADFYDEIHNILIYMYMILFLMFLLEVS